MLMLERTELLDDLIVDFARALGADAPSETRRNSRP